MVKLYFRLLFLIIFLFFIFNLVAFIVTGNARHLIMPSFFSERAASLYFYAIHKATDIPLDANIDKSIHEKIRILSYDRIDEALLITLANNVKVTEAFSLIGSPAPSFIQLSDFRKLSKNNPFNEDENILIAVQHIHELHSKGLYGKELALTFLLGDNEEKVKLFAPKEYERVLSIAQEFENEEY